MTRVAFSIRSVPIDLEEKGHERDARRLHLQNTAPGAYVQTTMYVLGTSTGTDAAALTR